MSWVRYTKIGEGIELHKDGDRLGSVILDYDQSRDKLRLVIDIKREIIISPLQRRDGRGRGGNRRTHNI